MTRGDILVLDARESQVPRADGGSGCGMVKLLYLTHFGDGRLSPIVWMSVVFLGRRVRCVSHGNILQN